MRVLFIGSSFTTGNNMTDVLRELAECLDRCSPRPRG